MNISELNLLVVEDDAFQRQLIVNMLHSLGATNIAEAADGQKAIDRVRDTQAGRIDLVLCDLSMPQMDGLEFLRHLSAESCKPTVIIASALDDKLLSSADRMAKMYGLHLLGVAKKPITLAYLKDMLSNYGKRDKKWQAPSAAAPSFTLEEIAQGLRDGQFEPFFQPKVDMRSGRLVGAEALARWVHPSLGVIAPYAFIPLLEQHRQLDALTFVMLQRAAEACRTFHAKGQLLTISVNLSLSSLGEAKLADQIIRMVKQAGVDPHYIVLEITESAAMTDTGQALENLTRLSMHGFVLSIDDYGTGYSSMQQLTRICFGELKIDQSFVMDATQDAALRIVVESSIEMAHKLQVKSVAEGVETQQHWDMLRDMGCDTAQGYFIAKPLSLSAFNEFITSYKTKLAPAAQLKSGREHVKLLVVDDDDFTRSIIVRILRDLGFVQTRDVASATAALLLCESQSFDLIVTDVDMPGMNGLEFAHRIRSGKSHAKADTRILILTGYSNSELLSVALALDVNGFLVKPIVPAVMEEKIMQALNEKLHLRPPLAYQAVVTGLPGIHNDAVSKQPRSGAAIIKQQPAAAPKKHHGVSIPLRQLRAGMTVCEDIYAKDGTLMMKRGQLLTELTINRLHDLSGFLQATSFAVEEASPSA